MRSPAKLPRSRLGVIGGSLALLAFLGMFTPRAARAQSVSVGDSRYALPGLVHVPVAGLTDRAASLAATGGYGYTEGVLGTGDHHDRLVGTLAGSVRPTPWLAFALAFDGRYDHDSDPVG